MSIFTLEQPILQRVLNHDLEQISLGFRSLNTYLRLIWITEGTPDPYLRTLWSTRFSNLLRSLDDPIVTPSFYDILRHSLDELDILAFAQTGVDLHPAARASWASCFVWAIITSERRGCGIERASVEVLDGQSPPVRLTQHALNQAPANDIATVQLELSLGTVMVERVPASPPGYWKGRASVAPSSPGGTFATWNIGLLEEHRLPL